MPKEDLYKLAVQKDDLDFVWYIKNLEEMLNNKASEVCYLEDKNDYYF